MNKQSLPQATKTYYDSQSLSEQQLDRYQAMLQQAPASSTTKSINTSRWWPAIASLLVIIVLSWQLFPIEQDIGIKIAQEVAKNHIKMKPLEVQSNQITDLKAYFTELDFALVEPSNMVGKTMQGARYCSIQGVTAAQFRYIQTDKAQSGITVYEVDYRPDVFGYIPDIDQGMLPREIKLKGLLLKLWVENNLLFVSAQEQGAEQEKVVPSLTDDKAH